MGHAYRMNVIKNAVIGISSSMLLVSASLSAQAQSQMAPLPQFVPASSWQIQSTPLSQLRGLEKMNLPCMMAASFDNGYVVRFSGNQGKMLAMAIDFRQNVFTQGRKYPADVKVSGVESKLTGTAFSQSTLIFNLRDHEGFYNNLNNAKNMTLNVEGNPMVFVMGGVKNAMSKLESCAAGNPVSNDATVSQASIPQPENSWMPPEKITQERAKLQRKTENSRSKTHSSQSSGLWQAKAGDDLRDVLSGWAQRAGVKLDWQATNAGKVVSDIQVNGTFEEAIQMLMAQNATALGLDANMKGVRPKANMRASMTQASVSQASVSQGNANIQQSPQSLLPSVSSPIDLDGGTMTPMPASRMPAPFIAIITAIAVDVGLPLSEQACNRF